MKKTFLTALLMAAITCVAYAEDGSRLWLRSQRNSDLCEITTKDKSNTAKIATRELATYWHGKPVSLIKDKTATGEEGFEITTDKRNGHITIKAKNSCGLLYGAYELLRLQDSGMPVDNINIKENPAVKYRILNHWDNLDRSVERGYAGLSIWKWDEINGDKGTMSKRVDRHQRLGDKQRERFAQDAQHLIYKKGKGAGRYVPRLRNKGLSLGELCVANG